MERKGSTGSEKSPRDTISYDITFEMKKNFMP
jgi:hypothetical protein